MMELDLNQEPLDQTRTAGGGIDSILNELESAHGQIEERIRHLEAVTSRAMQRQRWRRVMRMHTPIQITATMGLATADILDEEGTHQGEVGIANQERMVDNGKMGKRNSTHLVAKALEMDTEIKKEESSSGGFFDCNICLDMARDPILTCCGHLFCWPCFYQLSNAYSNAKECPVCKGEVTEAGVIPIYGSANVSGGYQLELKEAGLKVPPRPHAHRIESTRQQLISQGASTSGMQERIQQFSNLIGGIGRRVRSENSEALPSDSTQLLANISSSAHAQALAHMELRNRHLANSRQVSRLLIQGAASFSSLSSALTSAMDSAERLVEDLESYIHNHPIERNTQENPHVVNRDSRFSTAATTQSQSLTPDVVAATNSAVVASISPLGSNLDANAFIDSEIQTTDSGVQISSVDLSSSDRGTHVLRLPDSENGVSNEPRRRRLR